jgi:hypothetical protein
MAPLVFALPSGASISMAITGYRSEGIRKAGERKDVQCSAGSSDRVGLLNNILYKQEEGFNIRRALKHQASCYASYNEY